LPETGKRRAFCSTLSRSTRLVSLPRVPRQKRRSTRGYSCEFPGTMEIGRFRCAIQAVFGVRRQSEGRWSHAATALCLRCRTKALDEVSCLIIRSKAASRAGPPSLACRRSPKDASAPGMSFVGGTYRLDTKRVFDVATLGARASRPPRSGQRPLQWPSATIADGTSALLAWLCHSKNVQSPGRANTACSQKSANFPPASPGRWLAAASISSHSLTTCN